MQPTAPRPVLELFSDYVEVCKKDFGALVIGSLGLVAVTIMLTGSMLFLTYGVAFLGMLPGLGADNEDLILLGFMGGAAIGLILALFGYVAVLLPLQASYMRAVAAHLSGAEPIQINAPFSRATEDLPRILGFGLLHAALTFALLSMCYLPGLIFLAFTDFAWCRVVLDGESAGDAFRRAIEHARQHLNWHLGYILLTTALLMVCSYLPLIGPFITPALMTGWRVFVYRQVVEPAPAA